MAAFGSSADTRHFLQTALGAFAASKLEAGRGLSYDRYGSGGDMAVALGTGCPPLGNLA